MKRKSLFSNVIYSFLLQFTSLLFPLITAPYISRVIGAEGLGKVNFATSVVNWFLIFATFGSLVYGVREVARLRDNKHKLSVFFSEMMVLKLIATMVVLAVYLPCIFFIERFSREFWLFALNGTTLLLNIFSLDWFFQGVEDYKYITTRSVVFKIISIVAIFTLVKSNEHYIIYAGISVFALSFSNILNFIYARKYVTLNFRLINLKQHIKPLAVFLGNSLSASMYVLFDQMLLGFLRNDVELALYVRAKMFINLGMSLSYSLINAITPRIMNRYNNDDNEYNGLLRMSIDMLIITTLPIMIGIAILSDNLMFLFGGTEFIPAISALLIISPILIITPIAMWNTQQRILPLGCEVFAFKLNLLSAVLSVVLNIFLINLMGFLGTAVSWLIVEFLGAITTLMYASKRDSFRPFNRLQLKYMYVAGIMGLVVWSLKSYMSVTWLSLFMCMIIGAFTYFLLLFTIRDKYILKLVEFIKGFIMSKRSLW